MKHKTILLKTMISASLISAFSVTPVIIATPAAWAYTKSAHVQKHPVTLIGLVIKVDSNQQFDIRAGEKTYTVKAAVPLPRGLYKAETVRVSGQSSGNEINYARVEILRSTTRTSRHQDESFTGTVTKINSNRRFGMRVNGKIFNVNAANNLPRDLKQGDKVRVTGRKSGNDINNAMVARLSNR